MNSPLISKREYFLQTFSAAIERLNEAIQECDEQSYTQQGELTIQLEAFPEFKHENIHTYLAKILKEGGWEVAFSKSPEEQDQILLY